MTLNEARDLVCDDAALGAASIETLIEADDAVRNARLGQFHPQERAFMIRAISGVYHARKLGSAQ